MRWFSLLSLLGAAALGVAAEDAAAADSGPKATKFDAQAVPPLVELTPKNFETYLNQSKLLLVKYFSPYCHHCKKYAPTYQTVYEWYYTEKDAARLDSFSEHYNFVFGQVNCIANGDMCSQRNIATYPTTIMYVDGKVEKDMRGVKDTSFLVKNIEETLRQVYPDEKRPDVLLVPKETNAARPTTKEEAFEVLDMPAYLAKKVSENKPKDATAKAEAPKAEVPKAEAPKPEVPKAEAPKVEAPKADAIKAEAPKVEQPVAEQPKVEPPKDDKVINTQPKEAEKPLNAAGGGAGSEKVLESKDVPVAAEVPAKEPSKPHRAKTPAPINRGPPKSTATPNPNGVSVPLTAETFQTLVTMTQEPWFVKFYAPWCHHCKAMAATWDQLAKEMQGKLNIGEVNCDKDARLCKDARLEAYPSLLFFRGGERVEYKGLRGLGDFVHFSEDALALAGGVPDVTAADFEALEAKEEVIFVYFYDVATTTEDFLALERLPLSLIGHAKLVKTSDPALAERFKITTWPRLMVSREGRPSYYAPLTPPEMRNTRRVLSWMKSVWLPLLPELTASNAREIMDGKLVVLGILKRSDKEGFASAVREMKSAANEWMDKQIQLFQLERQELRDAKQLRIEEAEDRHDQRALRAAKSIRVKVDRADKKDVTFAWVDGVFWQRWVRTTYGIDIKDGDRVVINEEDQRRYWDQTITGNPILPSRTSILETLNKVTASPPKIKPRLTISALEKMFFDIRVTFSEHPYLSIGCVLGMSLGVASWLRGRVRRHGGSFRLDDGGGRDYKLPTLGLGANANGKVD